MSECSPSGRGQGHVSNSYIVDLEIFATASRRYKGDIHNWTVVGLFDTCDSGSRLGRVMVECTLFMTHCLRLNLQLHTSVWSGLVVYVVSALLRGNWQDYY